ncbi:MAG: iron-sulfur cluster assembly scaffold protein [Pseudomonadota bacterium]
MTDLYHNRVLELAADIPNLGHLEDAHGSAEKLARICGSTVRVDVRLSSNGGTVEAIAVEPKACALGQAATSVVSENAVGANVDEIQRAADTFRDMLKQDGEPPRGRFYELRHLQGVRDYPPRHASTLLVFDALLQAIKEAKAFLGLEAVTDGAEPRLAEQPS